MQESEVVEIKEERSEEIEEKWGAGNLGLVL